MTEDSPPPSSQENRAAPRRRALLGGRVFAEGGGAWDCLIRDLSEGGAKIRIDDPTDLAAGGYVDLKVNKAEDLRRAQVMWIRGTEIGLRFLSPMDRAPKGMERFFTLVKSSEGGS
jgi:two-component system cell cycle response regulator